MYYLLGLCFSEGFPHISEVRINQGPGVGEKTENNYNYTTGIFLYFACTICSTCLGIFCSKFRHFFPAGCLRICYSVRPQYWAKKDAISMETDRQSDPSAQSSSQSAPTFLVYQVDVLFF